MDKNLKIPSYPNILLVSGNGRDSGKTLFICSILEKLHRKFKVTALKICPHNHKISFPEEIIFSNGFYTILKDTKRNTKKDSTRMLKAGAQESYYIQSTDENLEAAFRKFITITGSSRLIICESGGLRKIIKPGIFLILKKNNKHCHKNSIKDLYPLADKIITYNGSNFDLDPENIIIDTCRWKLIE